MPTPSDSDPGNLFLSEFIDLRDSLRRQRIGRGGYAVCAALTSSLDRALSTLIDRGSTSMSVVALGGYGRGELSPYSDVDLMLLHQGGDPSAAASDPFSSELCALAWGVTRPAVAVAWRAPPFTLRVICRMAPRAAMETEVGVYDGRWSIRPGLQPGRRGVIARGRLHRWRRRPLLGDIFTDTTIAAAVLDRLLHRSVVIIIDGDSSGLRTHQGHRTPPTTQERIRPAFTPTQGGELR